MNILVRGARQLLTLYGPAGPRRGPELRELGLIHDGAVLIRDGVVVEAGPARRVENLLAARGAEEINAHGRLVMPGFVDSHTHLVYGRPWLDEYELRLSAAKGSAVFDPSDLREATRSIRTSAASRLEGRAFAAVATMVQHGTTTLEAKTGFGMNTTGELKILRVLAKLDRSPVDVTSTFLAVNWGELQEGPKHLEWLRSQLLPKVQRRKLARFADITCDNLTFSAEEARLFLKAAGELGFLLKVHAGPSLHPNAVRLAVEMGAVSVDHLEYAGSDDVDWLARSDTMATLTPGSSYYLGTRRAPARELIARGVPVALASDFNPHTSPTCSMQMVVSLACSELGMTPAETITAATINGAHALRRGERVGSLEPGKDADLLIMNVSDYREIPYRFGVNQVHMTMKRGVTIYAEGAVARARASP